MMPKNFRQIPNNILGRLQRLASDDVVVACVKQIRIDQVRNYAHLGLGLEGDALIVPKPALPPTNAGKYSSYNVHGKEVQRKDLPKIWKTYSFFAPSWGDYSKGYHLVSQKREVYQTEFIPPKEVELSVTLIAQQGDVFNVKFAIEQVLSRKAPDFEADLLYNLNILQENVGAVDVFESSSSFADYAATIRVDWELLPVGKIEPRDFAARLLQRKGATAEQQVEIAKRLETFERLRPTHFIEGSNEFVRYFGAKYEDDFVVFENIRYGNAMYVMFADWQILSRRSRLDLLKGPREGFERIEHREGWEDRLEALLQNHRKRKLRGFL